MTSVIDGTTQINGATTTYTQNASTFIWSTYTDYKSGETVTLGGSATVVSGTTLAPTTTTITPHPYPTAVASTTDRVLNTALTSWTPGKPLNLVQLVLQAAAHHVSLLYSVYKKFTHSYFKGFPFCFSNCPICFPGFGIDTSSSGSDSSGGGSDDDDGDGSSSSSKTSTSTSTSTEESTQTAAGGADFTLCDFPTTVAASSDLDALSSSLSSDCMHMRLLLAPAPQQSQPQHPVLHLPHLLSISIQVMNVTTLLKKFLSLILIAVILYLLL
ncbi:class v protein [Penicillium taxi]|uniref:class v protein n=1 Tax=Penicillium taxi TaxID=168475 RepID=UPI0025454257|nr:class v protein [Penicillium taxi]KAJ5902257.1 class v protein [Penicillium taxi]